MKKTILIADDDADVVDLLTRRCHALGLEVDSASHAMAAFVKAEQNLPDVAILDVDMPYGNGLSVCEMMASHETLRSVPVIILTSSSSKETVRRCHQLCAYYVLKCPDVWPRIEPILRELLAGNETGASASSSALQSEPDGDTACGPVEWIDTLLDLLDAAEESRRQTGAPQPVEPQNDQPSRTDQPWVLSVEDDEDFALVLRMRLEEFGFQVIRASLGREGYRRAFFEAPRAILLDYELPQGNGDYVLRRLKETPTTREIPVIVLTGRREASIERRMRALGASEFLTKPVDWTRLRAALEVNLNRDQASADFPRLETNLV